MHCVSGWGSSAHGGVPITPSAPAPSTDASSTTTAGFLSLEESSGPPSGPSVLLATPERLFCLVLCSEYAWAI